MFFCCQCNEPETVAVVNTLLDENPGKDGIIEQQAALSTWAAEKTPEIAPEQKPEEEVPEEEEVQEMVREFKVVLEKADGESANLALDTCAGVIEVCNIGPGPTERYNDSVDFFSQVQVGDFIVSVNGKSVGDNSSELLKEFGNNQLELVVRHPIVVALQLEKLNGSFGLDLTHAEGQIARSLAIFRVLDGPVQDWNQTSAVQVKKGDRIVAVNGKSGSPEELLECIQASHELDLQICCLGI